ncbi:MAG: sensor domain-containing diguanylate cyclase [Candidatus Thiodiazotropha lotti]|nr:sensor domain-containing diguanylate cyclase [Candidatus Thiodiazotropha lotti]
MEADSDTEDKAEFSERRELLISFLWLFIPVSLVLAGIFYAFSNQTQKYELQTALIREEAALSNASQLTSLIFVQKLSDLFVLAEGEVLRSYLHDENLKNWVRVAREFSLFARRKPKYMQIRYLNEQGMEVIRINNNEGEQEIVPRAQLQDKAGRYYFKESFQLNQGAIYISPLDLNMEKGAIEQPIRPTIRFATPVVDGYGEKRGVLIINYDPLELLQRIEDIFISRLGQAVMLNSDGYWLLGKPEEELWGFMYGHEVTFKDDHPDVWHAMESSDKGSFFSKDGLFVFQKTYPMDMSKQGTLENIEFSEFDNPGKRRVGERHWIYLSHISKNKIEELTLKRLVVAAITYLLLFIVTALISLFFARNSVQKKLAYRQLKQFATTDALTGLSNRRELEKVGDREFRRAKRFGRELSVMMLDLDHFKEINDTHNHTMGDEVLRHVVEILAKVTRGQDILFRYGGEEFLMLLPETHEKGAKFLASRICTLVSDKAYEKEHVRIPVTISIGVSTIEPDDKSYHEILIRADQALYQAKRTGRNRVVVYDDSIADLPTES